MGKTSFIQYVASIAEKDYNMIPVYVNNKGSDTIDELIGNLVDALFKEIDKTINSKRFEGFASSFHKTDEIVTKNNFKEFLVEICDDLEDNGIFFIIDDVNGLSENPKFANWYKGLFETLRFYNEYALVVFSIATSPSNFDELCKQNPSFCRMFNLINLSMI